jgi:hypothetical protein
MRHAKHIICCFIVVVFSLGNHGGLAQTLTPIHIGVSTSCYVDVKSTARECS